MLSLIAALSENNVIGVDGKLPWYLPRDLKYFKAKTLGKSIIMGRKTFESIGKRPLPDRQNIVITRQADYVAPGCQVCTSLEEACAQATSEEIFIVGGSSLYSEALPKADKLYLTRIHTKVAGDTVFPKFDETEWTLIDEEHFSADEKNALPMTFRTYQRSKPL